VLSLRRSALMRLKRPARNTTAGSLFSESSLSVIDPAPQMPRQL
jgi:hypothetical protein